MENIKGKRLGKLLDATLLRHCEAINLVDDTSLCDAMFKCLVNGDIDKEFMCPKLNDVSREERKEAFDIARKYAYLCFYEGNLDYWLDSVEEYNPNMPSELIAEKIVDNYNFLVELAHEKGESAVAELTNMVSEEMATKSSVVDYMRNSFGNDKILKEVLDSTSKDAMYKDLSPTRKRILYKYPLGTLYLEYSTEDGKDFMTVPKEQLLEKIAEFSLDDKVQTKETLSEVADSISDNVFESVIRDIYLESLENNKNKHK